MKSNEIRETFLEYFEKKGHKRLPSASLIPTDPTVLLTLAGMLPFKPIFLGIESPKYQKVTTVQKCIRMNDIEHVGLTTRHHTFFEMLGNFSFGDYFKADAISFAWELLTEVFKIDKNKLVIAIYEKDDEAFEIWNKSIGIPQSKIYRLSEDNNFWAAGPTGPCGPCSEIYYDNGYGCEKPNCAPACDCERFLEVWNLVFIQYNRDDKGELKPLPKKNIDTGMGLERIARVLQGKKDNFDTDIFEPILSSLPDKSASSKIIADHIRAATYLISDSVVPSNEGRGYVLRRLIRRAIVHGGKLKIKPPFLSDLSKIVIDCGKMIYPDLDKKSKIILGTVKAEENNFNNTLGSGMNMLEKIFEKRKDTKTITGEDAFKLHDTYGFPYEITNEIAKEKGFSIDANSFQGLMEGQRQRARAKIFKLDQTILNIKNELEEKHGKTEFIGFDKHESESRVMDVIPNENIVILDRTPFYPESGGQAGDTGIIGDSIIIGTFGEIGGIILHKAQNINNLAKDMKVKAKIDESKRKNTTIHHTATHLLQSALRKVLGSDVKQAGSSVSPDGLRFDLTFNRALNNNEIEEVERLINQAIKDKKKVEKFETSFGEAQKLGAIALFSEKYGEKVRVVRIKDVSTELCGGCHVENTSEIGFFKIIKEEALQGGIRRIEAIAGQFAKVYLVYKSKELSDNIENLIIESRVLQAKKELLGERKYLEADIFTVEQTELEVISKAIDEIDVDKVNRFLEHLNGRVDWLKERNKSIEKEICGLEGEKVLSGSDKLLDDVREIKGVKILAKALCEVNIDNVRLLGDKLKEALNGGIIILASTIALKVSFLVLVSEDLVQKGYNAGKIAKILSETCGGGGGGKPGKAEAGGRDISKTDEAIQKAIDSL